MPSADLKIKNKTLFKERSFRNLLAARITGSAANQMLMVALGWQMYELTGDALDLGVVGLAQFIPALLLTLPFGHLVDRHDRRWLLCASLAMQGMVALVLGVASGLGSIEPWTIILMSMLMGAARALQGPSQQALLPMLVPKTLLPKAVAAASSSMQAAVIAGPAVGGAIYAFGSPPSLAIGSQGMNSGALWVYLVALLLLASAVFFVLGIRPLKIRPPQNSAPGLSELTAGIRFIWHRRMVLGAISLDLFAVLLGGATALLPIFAKDILHAGPQALGLLRSAPALGAMLVGIGLSRFPLRKKVGHWLLGAVAIYGLSMICFSLATTILAAFVALLVSGASDMVSVVIRQSLVQLETPDDMRGRVGAVNSVFIGASNQLGEFESGVTASWFGPVGSVFLGGIGTLIVVATWFRIFPDLAKRDQLMPIETRP